MNYQLNPLMEFFGFGRPKSISYNQLCMINSNMLCKILNDCLNCCSKFTYDDQDEWEDNWYERCELIAQAGAGYTQNMYKKLGMPGKLLKMIEMDLYYGFRDPIKYSMYGNIVKDIQNMKKLIMKYKGKPYPLHDKTALKNELSIYNIELVD